MSRCFPYPPPGYTLSKASNDALIESIKLQKEREKANDQKKKRMEKKEKRKEKKDKRKEKKDNANHKLHNPDTGKSHVAAWPNTKHEFTFKGKEAETEHLFERSSLTEEHGQPMCSSVPSTSSDSTDTSNKRKRHPSPLKDSCGHGNIIRIKFTSKRQNDSNASGSELRLCSKSGGADLGAQNTGFNNLRDGRESSHSALKTDREQICTTSRPSESIALGKIKSPSVPRPIEKVVPNAVVMTSMQREETKYNKLFGSWSPPKLQDSCLDEDLDWPFQSRKPDVCAGKRRKIQNYVISSSAGPWPCAQLLQEVDIYALPFTVPF